MSADEASDIALLEKVLFRLASHAADDDSGMEATINRVLVPILPSVAKVQRARIVLGEGLRPI
jgi:hypothetical protein